MRITNIDDADWEDFNHKILQFFDDGLGDPITHREQNEDLKPFTYITYPIDNGASHCYEVSLDGEYVDDIWIEIGRLNIEGRMKYTLFTQDNGKSSIWTGFSLADLESDLNDCFKIAIRNRNSVRESVKQDTVSDFLKLCEGK